MSNLIQLNDNSKAFRPTSEANFVIHSKLNSYQKEVDRATLSVKLVLDGTERYTVNNKRYDLMPGEFLLVDSRTELGISFSDSKLAEGMCFYLDEKYLNQIFGHEEKGEKWLIDNYLQSNEIKHHLLPTKYRVKDSSFGATLENIADRLKAQKVSVLTEDFFLDFAAQLSIHQKRVFDSVNNLPSIKLATREELYCRVRLVRDYIEDNLYEKDLSIGKLSKISALSEVQLHRTFKQVYQKSPHQYILSAKMNRSLAFIDSGKYNFLEIALLLGFADLPSFSKAFKRQYGLSPKAYQKSN